MVAELTSITAAVASNSSHKSASSAGGRISHLPQWIQTATKNNTHSYTSSTSDQPMYTSVTKPNKTSLNKNQIESGKKDDVGFWRRSNVAGTSATDPVGLLNRQGPGRGIVGLVGPYRASTDKLDAMEVRGGDDDDETSGRIASDSVVGVSDNGGRMFVLRDEELVEEGDYRRSQEDLSPKTRNKSSEEEDGVDVSPTPGRENWRLRESKKLTAGGEGGDRRGISMTDIWPKDWGSKCVSIHFVRMSRSVLLLVLIISGYRSLLVYVKRYSHH